MKVTFPHMGKIYIPLKAVLEELKIDVVVPPKCSKKTAEEGIKVSPEGMCLPFKINMGNFIESIKLGADTILMISSCGDMCRVGMFCQLQQDILNDLEYEVNMLPVKPFGTAKDIKNFIKVLGKISGCKNRLFLYKTFVKGIWLMLETDKLFSLSNKVRPLEAQVGVTENILVKMEEEIKRTYGYKETIKLIRKTEKKLKNIEKARKEPLLKIGLVGEIYVLTENYTNMNIEKHLGEMGIEVHKVMTTGAFIKRHLDFIPFVKSELKSIEKDARPYLDKAIGGHTLETVGTAVMYKKKKYDGIIHVLPFGCMPEIVSEGILKEVEKKEEIPVLTMVFDEMTGEVGYVTRLEAFCDCLIRKKEIKMDQYELKTEN